MTSRNLTIGILQTLGIIVAILVSLYFLYLINTVIVYLIVALILTLIGSPIHKFLKNKLKFNNLFASITTLLIFISLIFGFIMLFVPLILSQIESLSLLNITKIEENIKILFSEMNQFLESHNINSSNILKQNNLTSKLNFDFIPKFVNSIIGTISSFGIGLGCVLFITFFFLKDKISLIIGIKKMFPKNHEEKILNSIQKSNELLSRYFIGLLFQLIIVVILYFIILLIFGAKNAFVIAFLCGILNIIPYVGPLIGAFFASVLTMISNINGDFQNETLPQSIYIFVGFIIIHLIDSNISQPIIFSKSVKSHPLEIFLVIIIAGILFGITGMIIAVPMFTMLKVILKEFLPENKIIQEITKDI